MNWVMEKAKTIHTFQNRTWHCIIMPLGSKIKTTTKKKKKWREEKDYTSRNQEKVKNKPEGRKSSRVACFSCSTQFNLGFLQT